MILRDKRKKFRLSGLTLFINSLLKNFTSNSKYTQLHPPITKLITTTMATTYSTYQRVFQKGRIFLQSNMFKLVLQTRVFHHHTMYECRVTSPFKKGVSVKYPMRDVNVSMIHTRNSLLQQMINLVRACELLS